MKITLNRWSLRRALFLMLGLAFALGLWAMWGWAQESERAGPLKAVRLGYTRPGYPEDKVDAKGNIRPVAWDDDFKGKLIGGTVYFMVLERKGTPGDTWGTGLANCDARFLEGKSFTNSYSPALDKQARYLYLYQIVNDRGLDPRPGVIMPAVGRDFPTEAIGVGEVKLIVDPRYLTSWGHFQNTAFTAVVADRNPGGDVRPVAEGASADIRLACSSNPSVLSELPHKRYRPRSPAYELGPLQRTFGIGTGNFNLKDAFAFQQLKKKEEVALVSWENNLLQAADTAKEPQFAQIVTGTNLEKGLPALEGEDMGTAVFRVDFRNQSLLKLGHHSTLFGFTSDLPPTDEPVLIKEAAGAAARGRDGIRPVADGQEGEGIVPAAAPGIVPTPTPPPAGGADIAPGAVLGFGELGGQPASTGGAAGAAPVAGSLGGARPPGGGISGGGGLGGGQGSGSQQQEQPPINFNATLLNQQSQNQSQWQQQSQTNCCNNGGVIPAPAAIILALLGLPALLLVQARRRSKIKP